MRKGAATYHAEDSQTFFYCYPNNILIYYANFTKIIFYTILSYWASKYVFLYKFYIISIWESPFNRNMINVYEKNRRKKARERPECITNFRESLYLYAVIH